MKGSFVVRSVKAFDSIGRRKSSDFCKSTILGKGTIYSFVSVSKILVEFTFFVSLKSLNEDTGQNSRRHVVLIKTSQMRTICTQIWRESCLLDYVFSSASLLGVVDFCRYVFS